MRGKVGAGGVAKPGPSRAGLLPTTLSWHSLPQHTLMLMDDALEHVDEDRRAGSKSAQPYDQARSAIDAAAATPPAAADAAEDAAAAAPLSAGAPQSPTKLNKALALAIFKAKRCKIAGRRSSLSAALGHRYGMTAKAVRDVWNGRTWAKVTEPFWTAEERKAYQVSRMQSDLKSKVRRIMAKASALPVNLSLVPTVPSASRHSARNSHALLLFPPNIALSLFMTHHDHVIPPHSA